MELSQDNGEGQTSQWSGSGPPHCLGPQLPGLATGAQPLDTAARSGGSRWCALEDRVIDWLGLDRVKMLQEVILAYEEEIALERSRVESVREGLTKARNAAEELLKHGSSGQVQGANLVAQQLQHRIETSEQQIQLMDDILLHFRDELAAAQTGQSAASSPGTPSL